MGQAIFVSQHRLNPTIWIGSDQFYNPVEIRSFESFPRKDLTHFFSLSFWSNIDMPTLDGLETSHIVVLCFRTEKVASRHRKAIGDQVGKAENDNHDRR